MRALHLALVTLALICLGLLYGVYYEYREVEQYKVLTTEYANQLKVAKFEKVSVEFDQNVETPSEIPERVKEDPYTQLLAQELDETRRELKSLREAYSHTLFEKQLSDLTKLPEGLDQFYSDIRATGLLKTDEAYNKWQCRSANEAWLALHDAGEVDWPKESLTYKETYGETPGERTAAFLDQINLWVYNDRFRATGAYPEIGSEERANAIYAFVNSKVKYNPDVADYPRFPVETFSYRSGDCEDMAILLASLLERAGYETALLTIVDETQSLYHAAALIKPDADWQKGTWPVEGSQDRWLLLDPSFQNEWGQDPEWASAYKKNGAVALPVTVSASFVLEYQKVSDGRQKYCS